MEQNQSSPSENTNHTQKKSGIGQKTDTTWFSYL